MEALKRTAKKLLRPVVLPLLARYRLRVKVRDIRRSLGSARGISSIDPDRPVFVFFAPEAGVVQHFAAHCVVARTLQELGHQVLLVRCFETYRHCIVLEMNRLPLNRSTQRRSEICASCAQSGLQMTSQYDLPTVQLSELVNQETLDEVRQLARSMPADAGEFEIDGVKFGALCGSDLALNTKKVDQLRVTGDARALLEAYVEAALLSYRATQALMRRIKVARLVFFNEYSMFMGAVAAAKRRGVPSVRISQAIHRNIDRRKIIIMNDPLAVINYHRCLDEWPKWRNLALSAETVEIISDNNLARLNASGFTVYSPKYSGGTAGSVFERLRLSPGRRLLVAYTSSLDEYFSNINLMAAVGTDLFQKEQPFPDQIAWLAALIEYVERSSDLQLVVRIHPREGANTREVISSEHLTILRERFSGAYENVRIVWPEDPISSYDLADIADVALTSWTNITLELARLGVPTITAFKRVNPCPTGEVVGWAPTPDQYFQLIERTLRAPVHLDAIRYAYRWSHLVHLTSYVDFGDIIPGSDFYGIPPFRLPAEAPLVESAIVHGRSIQEFRRRNLAERQSPASRATETQALHRQLRRVIWFLVTGEDSAQDYRLCCAESGRLEDFDAVLRMDGDFVEFRTATRAVRRRSRAICRLAAILAQVDDGVESPAAVA